MEEPNKSSSDNNHHPDSSFAPLIRHNSIQRCYGCPSTSRRLRPSRSTTRNKATTATISTRLRWTTNAAALLSCFLFAGIIFGWAPLKLILLREGQYQELCGANNDTTPPPCTDQMDRFNLIFTLAQFFLSFSSLPVGFMLDHSSKMIHYGVAAVFCIGGLFLFGISDSSSHNSRSDYFVLSYSVLSLGGCMTMLGAFPASFLLPHHQAGILAAISCLFDASSIIFAVFERLNNANAQIFSRLYLFAFQAMIGVVIFSLLSYCWAKLERLDWKLDVEGDTTNGSSSNNSQEEKQEEGETTATSAVSNNTAINDSHLQHVRRLGMHERPLLKQLQTFEFVLVLCFASVHMLRCNFYIETINEILATMGDANAKFANIFSFVLPCGIVFVPLIEATVNRLGVVQTLHCTNALGVLFGALLLIPSLHVQTLNFAIFTCFRAFLYATLNTFIAVTFGVSTMGRVIGSTFTAAAVVTLLQYPAAAIAETRHKGDFTIINAAMLSICAIPIALALIYSKSIRTNSRGEERPLLLDSGIERKSPNLA